jgi:hypothetical protein
MKSLKKYPARHRRVPRSGFNFLKRNEASSEVVLIGTADQDRIKIAMNSTAMRTLFLTGKIIALKRFVNLKNEKKNLRSLSNPSFIHRGGRFPALRQPPYETLLKCGLGDSPP